MKTFYKYTICFLLGIIIYYLLFKENIIEGNVFEEESSQLNRGCSKYTCKNDPSTYDNYQKKIYSTLSDRPQEYNNCLPISEQEIYHSRGTDSEHQPLSDGEIVLCTNEICCENFICSENAENITCPDGQIFLPNNKCDQDMGVEQACTLTRCCSELTGIEENVNALEELFDNIIEFRDNRGGKNNGQFITGEDILFYFYYKFLDIKKISELFSPLDLNGEKFPSPTEENLSLLENKINSILGKITEEDTGNKITERNNYIENEYENKPVFFNDDVKLHLDFDDNCAYNLRTRSKIVNNKDDYFPQVCIGYNNKIERYAFYKNITSYDNSVSLRLKDTIFNNQDSLQNIVNIIKSGITQNPDSFCAGNLIGPLHEKQWVEDPNSFCPGGKAPNSGLFEGIFDSVCSDIDMNYNLTGRLNSVDMIDRGFRAVVEINDYTEEVGTRNVETLLGNLEANDSEIEDKKLRIKFSSNDSNLSPNEVENCNDSYQTSVPSDQRLEGPREIIMEADKTEGSILVSSDLMQANSNQKYNACYLDLGFPPDETQISYKLILNKICTTGVDGLGTWNRDTSERCGNIDNYNTLDVSIISTQKIYRPNDPDKNNPLEIYDTYNTLKSNANITYPEYRLFNKWLNKLSLDDAEIDRKIAVNSIFNITNISSATYTNGYDSNGEQIIDNQSFDSLPIDIPSGANITITVGDTNYDIKTHEKINEGSITFFLSGLPPNLDISNGIEFSYAYTKSAEDMGEPCNMYQGTDVCSMYTTNQCISGYENINGELKDISAYEDNLVRGIWENWYLKSQREQDGGSTEQELVSFMRSQCCGMCFSNYGETIISGTLTPITVSSSSALNSIITSNSEYTEGDDELNLKKLILNLDRNTSYHNLKPLDKLFHTYIGSSKNTLISKEMFIALNN